MGKQIGTFYGESINEMEKPKLLEVIKFLAEENKELTKKLYDLQDEKHEHMLQVFKKGEGKL